MMQIQRGIAGSLRRLNTTVTFTGAAGLGAVGNVPIYTVTGEVLIVALAPVCTVDLGQAAPTATMTLGVTGSTGFFVSAATTATDVVAGDLWIDATPAEVNAFALPAGFKDIWCTDNIVATVAAQAVNAGAIRFDLWWMPLSPDGSVS